MRLRRIETVSRLEQVDENKGFAHIPAHRASPPLSSQQYLRPPPQESFHATLELAIGGFFKSTARLPSPLTLGEALCQQLFPTEHIMQLNAEIRQAITVIKIIAVTGS